MKCGREESPGAEELPALVPSHSGCPSPSFSPREDFSKDSGTLGLWESKARCSHEATDGSVNSFIT